LKRERFGVLCFRKDSQGQLMMDPVKPTHKPTSDPFEHHYTPQELGELWGFHPTTIRSMFIDEPGVLKVGKQGRRDGKRDYISLRIPSSVAQRVYERKTR
jgi:hypothetical protein